jgi:hypothetical protein
MYHSTRHASAACGIVAALAVTLAGCATDSTSVIERQGSSSSRRHAATLTRR